MKFLKKILTLLLIIVLSLQLSYAKTGISIKVNGKYLSPDVAPFISNSSTYVPIRFISEALNINDITWNPSSNSVTIKYNNKTLVLFVNKNYAYLNNEYIKLENNALIVNSRTFIPVRFVSNCFDANVEWDDNNQTVIINSSNYVNSSAEENNSNDSIYWLSRIIEAEASGEPYKGKVAVGEVILNRVKSNDFPNTIWGVIFDDNFGIQFEPVSNGTIYNTPSSDSISAAKDALDGSNYVGECLYFLNPTIAKNNWIIKNREYYTTISNHDFYI